LSRKTSSENHLPDFEGKERIISLKYDLHTKTVLRTHGNQHIVSGNQPRWSSSETNPYSTGQKAIYCSHEATLRSAVRTCARWKKVAEVIQVARTQLSIVPAFAITTYKAQGLTMNKIVVDLQVPLGKLQVASIYVPLSRVKRAEDVAILRPFDMKVLQVRPSPAQDAELKRLDELGRKIQRECAPFTF
jgi:hypothetical protein